MDNNELRTVIYQSDIDHCRFTIAIPTYKRANLLVEAVRYSLGQYYFDDYEVLVSDNNPERDDETEICMRQFKDNPYITYYKNKKNLGVSANFDSLYINAKGDYVVMLHDDDFLVTNYLELMDSFLRKRNYDAVWPLNNPIKERQIPKSVEIHGKVIYKKMKPQDFSAYDLGGPPSGMILRKDVFKKVGSFNDDFQPFNDVEWASRASQRIRCCRLMLPMLYYYWGCNVSMTERVMRLGCKKHLTLRRSQDKRMPLLWRPISRLCDRAVYWEHKRYIRNLCGNEYLYDRVLKEESVFDNNIVMDYISKSVRYIVQLYLKLARTRFVDVN